MWTCYSPYVWWGFNIQMLSEMWCGRFEDKGHCFRTEMIRKLFHFSFLIWNVLIVQSYFDLCLAIIQIGISDWIRFDWNNFEHLCGPSEILQVKPGSLCLIEVLWVWQNTMYDCLCCSYRYWHDSSGVLFFTMQKPNKKKVCMSACSYSWWIINLCEN